jgi:DNA-binding NarL/FixJ family response regulator
MEAIIAPDLKKEIAPGQSEPREDAKARILLINVNPMFGRDLSTLLENLPDLQVSGRADNPCEAFQMIAALKPDLAAIDVLLDDLPSFELLKNLQKYYPGLPVIMLSIHDEIIYAEKALHAGVKGYVMISEPVAYILGAIREVLQGGLAFSHNVTQRMLQRSMQNPMDRFVLPVDRLSSREKQILELIGQGISSRKISMTLEISIKTVQAHRENLKKKLAVSNGLNLTLFAMHWLMSKNRASHTQSEVFGRNIRESWTMDSIAP